MKWGWLLGCSLAILPFSNSAQTSKEVEITAEPHHHLVLQNKYVRVFKVEVAPREATLMHRHQRDYAYVTIGASEIVNDVAGKGISDVKLQDGETRFSPGNFAHAVRNVANTPFRNITIEFLQPEGSGQPWADDRGLQILNGGTRDILFVKDGVRASDVQLNPGATLPKDRAARAELVVAVSNVRLQSTAAAKEITIPAGDFRWLQSAPGLINEGKQPVRFITFEFP